MATLPGGWPGLSSFYGVTGENDLASATLADSAIRNEEGPEKARPLHARFIASPCPAVKPDFAAAGKDAAVWQQADRLALPPVGLNVSSRICLNLLSSASRSSPRQRNQEG